jgi:hypothetical protein
VADGNSVPEGAVSLSDAIASLRGELMRAWWDGRSAKLRFKPAPVELTLEVGVTGAASGKAGVKWWLIELGGDISREKASTQTIKLILDPVMVDREGNPVELLIDADDPSDSGGQADAQLDAAD